MLQRSVKLVACACVLTTMCSYFLYSLKSWKRTASSIPAAYLVRTTPGYSPNSSPQSPADIMKAIEAKGLKPVLKSKKRDSTYGTDRTYGLESVRESEVIRSNAESNPFAKERATGTLTTPTPAAMSLDGVPEEDLIRLDVPLDIRWPRLTTSKDEQSTLLVPNIVHYIWIGANHQFTFTCYLSFLSVHRFIAPWFIFVHGNFEPNGTWWRRTLQDVDNIYYVYKEPPAEAPSGKRWAFVEHSTDFMRLEVINRFGGIYLDTDVLALKSFNPLRVFQAVIGRERRDGCALSIIVSVRESQFYRMLLEQYKDYRGYGQETWANRAVEYPHRLAVKHPNLIHVEETSLLRPNWLEMDEIYKGRIDWSEKYAMHLWVRAHEKFYRRKLAQDVTDVDCLRTTFGEMARYVLYGLPQLRCDSRGHLPAPGLVTRVGGSL